MKTKAGKRMKDRQATTARRPPAGRMRRMLGLIREGQYLNCSTIAKAMEMSVKTVARDLDWMRDQWGLPLVYDARRHGFYLKETEGGFPLVPMTAKELFAVCMASQAIEHYRGTPLQQPLEQVFKRLSRQLDDEERYTLQSLDEVLSFRPFAPDEADLRVFEVVTEAVTERRALRFEYRKPGEKTARTRQVHPYHLMEFGGRWYLLAHDPKLGRPVAGKPNVGLAADVALASDAGDATTLRKFVLGRMQNVAMTEERFEVPEGFNAKAYFDASLGVMTGGGDYRVVIEMDAWLTDILRGRRFHPSQEVVELPGGGSQLRLRLSCLEEIEQYILSWGTHATVMEPVTLRERLFKTAEALCQRYGGPWVLHEVSVVQHEPGLCLVEHAA